MSNAWYKAALRHKGVVMRDNGTARSDRGAVIETYTSMGTQEGFFSQKRNTLVDPQSGKITVIESFWSCKYDDDIRVHDRLKSIVDARGSAAAMGTFVVLNKNIGFDHLGRPYNKICEIKVVNVE
jgi:hypothetical protein